MSLIFLFSSVCCTHLVWTLLPWGLVLTDSFSYSFRWLSRKNLTQFPQGNQLPYPSEFLFPRPQGLYMGCQNAPPLLAWLAPSHLLGLSLNVLENSVAGFFFFLKLNVPYDPENPLLGTYPGEMKTSHHTNTCCEIFRAALFMKAKRWKQPSSPSPGEWMSKMWSACMVEYYLAMKGHELLPTTLP